MSMNLSNPREAEYYLIKRKYAMVSLIPHKMKLVFRKDSGDDSWENGLADQNGWVREEYGSCCLWNMLDDEEMHFCDCGVGINKFITWAKVKEGSTSGEMEKILYRDPHLREQIYDD